MWRQAENQVKELLLERKILRQGFVESARQNTKVAEQIPTNTPIMLCTCWPENTSDGRTILHKTNVPCPVHGCTA